MSCVITNPVVEASLQAGTSSWEFVRWGTWFPVPGGETINATVVVKNASTYFMATPTAQYAAVRTKDPGAAAVLDSEGTNTAELFSVDVSADTAEKAWARVGIAVKDTNDGFGQGDVALYVSRTSRGLLLASGAVQFNPSTANRDVFIPIGGAHPTLSITKLKLAVFVQEIEGTGDLDFQLAYRTFATDPEVSSAWQKPEGSYTTAASNTGYNTGLVAPVAGFTGKAWFQPGIVVRPSSTELSATLLVSLFGKM